jgi:hypothetical protein
MRQRSVSVAQASASYRSRQCESKIGDSVRLHSLDTRSTLPLAGLCIGDPTALTEEGRMAAGDPVFAISV